MLLHSWTASEQSIIFLNVFIILNHTLDQFDEQYLLSRLRRLASKRFVCKIGTVLAEVQSVVLIQTLKYCPPRVFFNAFLNCGTSNILSIKSSFIHVLEKCDWKELWAPSGCSIVPLTILDFILRFSSTPALAFKIPASQVANHMCS